MAHESKRRIHATGRGNGRVARTNAQFERAEKNRQKQAAKANRRNTKST